MQGAIRQSVNILRNFAHHKRGIQLATRSMSSVTDKYKFNTLEVTAPKEFVYEVALNRPDKLNAMNKDFWREIRECFQAIGTDPDCRVVVLSAKGRFYTAGLDMMDMVDVVAGTADLEMSRKVFHILPTIRAFQESFTSIEKCPKPVLAAIHSGCIGGGVDMTSACDVRYCTNDAFFQIKEVDLGLAADVGTLQRFPKVVGSDSLARELAYTARRMYAAEALQFGFVSRVFETKEEMMTSALDTAAAIAERSPVAVQGTKMHLVYSRDHSVDESLDYIAMWNASMLQSEDVMNAATASMQKQKAKFSKL